MLKLINLTQVLLI